MSGLLILDAPIILLALMACWRILCIGKDADIRQWRGTRKRFMMLTTLYALAFCTFVALMLNVQFGTHLAIVTLAAWLFVRRNPFGR